jgi:hypothetical protein
VTTWRSSAIPTGVWWYRFPKGDITTVTTRTTLRAAKALTEALRRRRGCCIPAKEAIAKLSLSGIFNRIPIALRPSRQRVGEKRP